MKEKRIILLDNVNSVAVKQQESSITNSSIRILMYSSSATISIGIVNLLQIMILTKWISQLILKMCKFSPIKHTNTLLGGIFGLFKGYISILVCMCCLRAIIVIKQDVSQIFSEESISNTMIFNKIYENNPIYNFFIGVSN